MGFLQLVEQPEQRTGKTKVFSVINYARTFLGTVKWHSPWRRYVFLPAESTLFDPECLHDMADLLVSETNKQKETWK